MTIRQNTDVAVSVQLSLVLTIPSLVEIEQSSSATIGNGNSPLTVFIRVKLTMSLDHSLFSSVEFGVKQRILQFRFWNSKVFSTSCDRFVVQTGVKAFGWLSNTHQLGNSKKASVSRKSNGGHRPNSTSSKWISRSTSERLALNLLVSNKVVKLQFVASRLTL